ncbi:hypothetical protein HU200_019743 [Digitaria exilis]|uniref:GATA-type domain-containing protein n=1 Tax=Digitaria exilis TaxID=1010633 RepID=A0A835F2D3_9POAL|nr:hypothetical protein HU200_019743 [Digitaria exilis]
MLLSVVVSFFDRDVRRRKRSTHLAGGGRRSRAAATKWSDFRLSAVPPPPPPPPAPAPVEKCSDCGTTTTPQWRSGPMGPRTLCTNCGSRRRLAGERWGKPRCTWRGAVMARAAKARAWAARDQPPAAQQVSPPVLAASPPSTRICEDQGLEIRASPNQVTTSPPPPAPATAVSDHPPPPQKILPVPASSPPSSRICAQGFGPAPSVLTSPPHDRVRTPPPATESLAAPAPTPATAVSDHPPPPAAAAQEIPRPRVLFLPPPASIRSICEQGLALAALAPDVLRGRTPSPNPVTHPSPAPVGRELLPPESSSAPGRRRKQQPKRRWVRGSTCQHCGSTSTPQWRGGPDGRRSLCNACGVRYRQGRLLPEYRPKASPTFDRNVHASWHSEVLRRRRRRNSAPMMMTPPPPATMTLLPPPPPPIVPEVNVVAREPRAGANNADPMDGPVAPVPFLMLPPPSPPVANLASEPRADGANEDDSATNAMEELGPLDPFLLDGPAAPMLIGEDGEPTRFFIFFK